MPFTVGMTFTNDRGTYRRTVPQFPFTLGDCAFAESALEHDDWLALTLPTTENFPTCVPREKRILILGEPSPMHTITADYANQFGILVSPYDIEGFRGSWFPSHPGLPWMIGRPRSTNQLVPYADLVNLPVPSKIPELSVVVSNKAFHEGHRLRLRFVDHLRQRLGNRLHIFGRGIREIEDKADAILPYAFHLSLENASEPNYWSEKLSDALLGYAFPLYAGCPNVHDWLPENCLRSIDLGNFEQAADDVVNFMEHNDFESLLPHILAGREAIVQRETVFHVVARAIEANPVNADRLPQADQIVPLKKPMGARLRRKSVRLFHRLTFKGATKLAS